MPHRTRPLVGPRRQSTGRHTYCTRRIRFAVGVFVFRRNTSRRATSRWLHSMASRSISQVPTRRQENDARRKQALSIEKFAKEGKQHTLTFGLLHGNEHIKERLACLDELGRVLGARPELFTVDFAPEDFGEQNPHYVSRIKEGGRKVVRMGAGGCKKPSFPRIALNSVGGKCPRWECPTTCPMRHPAGLWLSRIIPMMGEKVTKASWIGGRLSCLANSRH